MREEGKPWKEAREREKVQQKPRCLRDMSQMQHAQLRTRFCRAIMSRDKITR